MIHLIRTVFRMDNALILRVQIDWSGSSELSLYNLSRHDEAIRCHNRAMERNPYYRTAFCNRACSKVKEGNIYDALAGLPVLFSLSDYTYLRIISTN